VAHVRVSMRFTNTRTIAMILSSVRLLKVFSTTFLLSIIACPSVWSQTAEQEKISIQSARAGGSVYFLYCVNGFGGGNVAASIGDDGVLLVDDMFAWVAPKLEATLHQLSDKPLRIILNTHFHRDHIEANSVLRNSAIIIAHKNVPVQLQKNSKDAALTKAMLPMVTYADSISVHFNGENIRVIHVPNSHTDSDAMVYFTRSKVLHLGDMFFFGMFPGVYAQGGGNIRQLIASLEKIVKDFPADVKIIPGHGGLATMKDLIAYVAMLKKTTAIVEQGIREGKSLDEMKTQKVLAEFDDLGKGGAQTTDQYLSMLYGLLGPDKK
jgi:cyclase